MKTVIVKALKVTRKEDERLTLRQSKREEMLSRKDTVLCKIWYQHVNNKIQSADISWVKQQFFNDQLITFRY